MSRLPKGQVLSGCEAELQELMKQIDCMVQQKKGDWERERQQLQARLDIREQEYHIQKATMEQKHQEVQRVVSWYRLSVSFGKTFLASKIVKSSC